MASLGVASPFCEPAMAMTVAPAARCRGGVVSCSSQSDCSRVSMPMASRFLGGRGLGAGQHYSPADARISTCNAKGTIRSSTSQRSLRVEAGVPGGKCPFGFSGDALRENREAQRGGGTPPSAVSSPTAPATPRPQKLDTTAYGPAPSSRPGAFPIGPNNFEYLPFKVPYKIMIGVEPLAYEGLVEIDEFYAEEMELRKNILDQRGEVAIARLPMANVEEVNWELCHTLTDYLATYYPDKFVFEGPVFHNKVTGARFDLSDKSLDPLYVCGRNVQEDLCLMLPDSSGELKFVSGIVAFPQRWQLLQKLGMNLEEIHLPVPFYPEIGFSVRCFMEGLKVNKIWTRANWAVVDDPTLFQPLNEEDIYAMRAHQKIKELSVPVSADNAGERLYTRCEREVFMRLPKTNGVLFTIRTYVKPLKVFDERPMLADSFVKALDALPQELKDYKGMEYIQGFAREYLNRIVQRHLSAGTYKSEDAVPAAKGPAIIGWKGI